VFDGSDPAAADAEVFASIAGLLRDVSVTASTGDIGILRAAVQGLNTTGARRAALLRHLWRPRRFKALLDRFGGVTPMPATRAALLASADPMADMPPLLKVRASAPHALTALRDISVDLPSISAAVDGLAARLDALDARNIDVQSLPFEASFGRSSMEYYDGFVFGFEADPSLNLPPVATGGRYDALTTVLGGGTGVPAVGGVIRPALVATAEGLT